MPVPASVPAPKAWIRRLSRELKEPSTKADEIGIGVSVTPSWKMKTVCYFYGLHILLSFYKRDDILLIVW